MSERDNESTFHAVDALSPLDGRYREKVAELAPVFSERGLMRARVEVEVEYMIALSELPDAGPRELTDDERRILRAVAAVELDDAHRIKEIESVTNHDVKAVEYYIREELAGTSLEELQEWVHFGLTSEDVNNIAYGLMLREGVEEHLQPAAVELEVALQNWAGRYADVPMLGRTHGQPASPTTVGKEFSVFAARLGRQIDQLEHHAFLVKLNGATGNYNAHHAAHPEVDWMKFTEDFIKRFNSGKRFPLEANPVTTQIEPHDTYAELFHNIARINAIITDFNQDLWRYISDGWVKQKPKTGEVGSSTMPQKVNPINLENSEGNAGISTAYCHEFARKLPVSRLQRDLSDSTVERFMGSALAHTYMALAESKKGLGKCELNEPAVAQALSQHAEVLTEAVQTVLRREGVPNGYELMKEFARGQILDLPTIYRRIGELPLSDAVKQELLQLTPERYTGLAERIALGNASPARQV